jgi:hypothetical protein
LAILETLVSAVLEDAAGTPQAADYVEAVERSQARLQELIVEVTSTTTEAERQMVAEAHANFARHGLRDLLCELRLSIWERGRDALVEVGEYLPWLRRILVGCSRQEPAPSTAPAAAPRPDVSTPTNGAIAATQKPVALNSDLDTLADALLSSGHALESRFVRSFKRGMRVNWLDLIEDVFPGQDREWPTVKTWAIRTNNAIADIDPNCNLRFSSSLKDHTVFCQRRGNPPR